MTHGAPALLHEEIGYTAERIAERIRAAMDRPSATIAGRYAVDARVAEALAGRRPERLARDAARRAARRARPVRDAQPRGGRRCSPARCASARTARARSKPGQLVATDVELTVDEVPRFVSRGGIKLANALAGERPRRRRPALPRRRRLDRRLHRLPARGRAPRTSSRSTSPTASSAGGCAAIPRVTVIERFNARNLRARARCPTLPR